MSEITENAISKKCRRFQTDIAYETAIVDVFLRSLGAGDNPITVASIYNMDTGILYSWCLLLQIKRGNKRSTVGDGDDGDTANPPGYDAGDTHPAYNPFNPSASAIFATDVKTEAYLEYLKKMREYKSLIRTPGDIQLPRSVSALPSFKGEPVSTAPKFTRLLVVKHKNILRETVRRGDIPGYRFTETPEYKPSVAQFAVKTLKDIMLPYPMPPQSLAEYMAEHMAELDGDGK